MSILFDLCTQPPFSLSEPVPLLFLLQLLLANVALHPDDLLLHPSILALDLLRPVPLPSEQLELPGLLLHLELQRLALLQRVVQVT